MSSVGQILREERQRQGLELPNIAQQTRINLSYLQAIEADDPTKLPGSFFYRSFVRQYAEFLGVDTESLKGVIEKITAAQTAPGFAPLGQLPQRLDLKPLPQPGRSSEPSRLPFAVILLLTAIVASTGLYVLWQRLQQPPAETRTEAPAPVRAPAPATKAPEPVPSQTAPAGAVGQPAAEQPSEKAPEPRPVSTAKPPSIEFMATEEVWVSASADGKEIVSRVLKPGETRTVTGVEKVSLLAGNAGGLIVTANGKLLDTIGPRGQVRIVDVTAQGVEIRGPTPKKLTEKPIQN